MTTHIKDFVYFIREQGVMGLAIGFILGGAVSTTARSLVDDIINPLLGLFLESANTLNQWTIGVVKAGSFIVAIIDLLVLAAVVYFIFKGLRLDKIDIKKQK
jgi:large conductance mechanosensitive channel